MKLRSVDPSTIGVPETRVTAEWDEEKLEMFRASIDSAGQLEPILCIEKDGQLVLVDGLHRLMEAIRRGDKRVSVAVNTGEDVDVLTQNIVTNQLRGRAKASEIVAVVKVLIEEHGMDSDAIRDKTGLSRDYLERLMWIAGASADIRAALDEELIGVGAAYEMSRRLVDDEQERMLNLQIQYRWPLADLRHMIDLVEENRASPGEEPPTDGAPAPLAPAPERLLATCAYCSDRLEPRQLVSRPMCPSCAGLIHTVLAEQRRLQEDGAPA